MFGPDGKLKRDYFCDRGVLALLSFQRLMSIASQMNHEDKQAYEVPQAEYILVVPKSILMTSDENEPIIPGPDY